MQTIRRSALQFAMSSLIFAMLLLLCAPAWAQQAAASGPVIDDWTHHRLVFSNPGTADDAFMKGSTAQRQKVVSDPRYRMQVAKRSAGVRNVVNDVDPASAFTLPAPPPPPLPTKRSKPGALKKDWNAPIGNGAEATVTAVVNSVTGSTVTSASQLTIDGQIFTASAPTAAAGTVTFSGLPTAAQTLKIANGATTLTLTLGAAGTGTIVVHSATIGGGSTITIGGTIYDFHGSSGNCASGESCISNGAGSTTGEATDIAAAINGTSCLNTCVGADTHVFATVSASTVTLTNLTASSVSIATSLDTSLYLNNVSQPSSTVAAPSPATNTCASSTGTFVYEASTTAMATNLAAEINACYTFSNTFGVNAISSTNMVTITAQTLGSGGASIALTNALTNSTPSGSSTLGGTNLDGVNSGTTFKYWTTNTYDTPSQLATDIAAAAPQNSTVNAALTVTPNSSNILFTAKSGGTVGNGITVTEGTSTHAFTALGATTYTLAGGLPGAMQPNMYPAKYGASLTTASCANDFVIYPTGQPGGAASANLIAYNQLYPGVSGCTTVPSVYWAYNTGAGQWITTSPIYSFDGKQVAVIESNGTTASLVLIKWATNSGETLAAPVTLTNLSASGYQSCTPTATVPCMYATAFANGANDTFSSPFYVYAANQDVLYVGDDTGNLHKFSGVFLGTPAEVGNPWVASLSGTPKLGPPVYDVSSGNIFVAGVTNGDLYSVTASTGTVHGSTGTMGDAIADSPLVDGSSGTVYAFVTTSSTGCFSGDNVMFQFSTGFTSYGGPGCVFIGIGGSGSGHYLYDGTFDNVYFENTANATGSLYVVGNTGVTTGATLYRVPINGGSLSAAATPVTAITTSGAYPWPSPATEYCNSGTNPQCLLNVGQTATTTGTDYLFFSVNQGNHTNHAGCTAGAGNGCILTYNISTTTPVAVGTGFNTTTTLTNGCWATSGMVIDNSGTSTTDANANIYYAAMNGTAAGGPSGSTIALTSSGCTATAATAPALNAIQLSQTAP